MEQIWKTNEPVPRRLVVKGRSAIDPDCLVAYAENSTKPLWIVDGTSKTENCYVCGLEGNVYASRLIEDKPTEAMS